MTFIVDSSVALSWCFEDEHTAATHALLERIAEAGALAPQHWPLEVLNGLMMGERRKRIDAAVLYGTCRSVWMPKPRFRPGMCRGCRRTPSAYD